MADTGPPPPPHRKDDRRAAPRSTPTWPDDAPCGLLTTDAWGTVLQANALFCRWVGRSPQALRAMRLQDLLTMGGRIFHQTHWAPLLRMQGSVSEVKFELQDAEGRAFPVVLNAVRRDRAGTVTHDIAVFVARDRDKYERELLRSQQQLQAAVAHEQQAQAAARAYADFAEQMVGIVSHDLRNPLGAIHTAVQVLQRDNPTAFQQTLLARTARSLDRANRLVGDLLDFTAARVGSGIAVRRRDCDLHQVVADAVGEAQLRHPGRVVEHRRTGDAADGTAPCWADADRMAQLIGNLLANALAYGNATAPVTVTSHAGPAGCRVAVHNVGEPIAPDTLRGLFQPMVRGSDAGAGSRSVGLGLFIVEAIARAHGGMVAVQSDADGTTFTVELPARAADGCDGANADPGAWD